MIGHSPKVISSKGYLAEAAKTHLHSKPLEEKCMIPSYFEPEHFVMDSLLRSGSKLVCDLMKLLLNIVDPGHTATVSKV